VWPVELPLIADVSAWPDDPCDAFRR
jgi:hypothetical protein